MLILISKFIQRLALVVFTLIHQREFRRCGKGCYFHNIKVLGGDYIDIGNNVIIQSYSTISAWHKYHGINVDYDTSLTIGDNCSFGTGTHITCANLIKIGNGVLLGKNVTITDNSHGQVNSIELETPPSERKITSKGAVIIEDNVWIGDKVTILSNVKIGRGAIIGANSVVTKDIPEKSVCAGNPCKIIKVLK